jgi:hypothetical protein
MRIQHISDPPFVFMLEDISIYPKVKRCLTVLYYYIKIWIVKNCAYCQKSNYQILYDLCRYFMDTRTLSYLGIWCQIEIKKMGF